MQNIKNLAGQLALLVLLCASNGAHSQQPVSFPGVSRDLATFCSSRPSLSIDLVPMIVHVKRNTSFNYKLYLMNSNDFVFQTGQIIPRDNFKIHSFPVKFKGFQEFLGRSRASGGAGEPQQEHLKTYRYQNASADSLVQVANSAFNWHKFFRLVPIAPEVPAARTTRKNNRSVAGRGALDNLGDGLPGDASSPAPDKTTTNPNEHIQFDRDDQLELLNSNSRTQRQLTPPTDHLAESSTTTTTTTTTNLEKLILPVGSFSSFQVNLTYLVRKDFDQIEPEIVKMLVDAGKFQVTQMILISNGSLRREEYPSHEDYNFLSHKLLRDPNTRITSISQIYEDWITRNFYTIVYIQRRLDSSGSEEDQATGMEGEEGEQLETDKQDQRPVEQTGSLVTDRLIFRGSSPVLLGAEQLDYDVKASAFITEKNGLHYYLEFLTNGKFYLCAIDWTKRPFKIIDSRKFPMKQTKTMFDNEELLLCPPALCYSEQPVDELVAYGRLPLTEHGGHQLELLKSFQGRQVVVAPPGHNLRPIKFTSTTGTLDSHDEDLELSSGLSALRVPRKALQSSQLGALNELVESIKSAASQLEVRLHLRDWTWTLPRSQRHHHQLNQEKQANSRQTNGSQPESVAFVYRFEWAKRNDIKVNQDTYGFELSGHQMDASYRVFNELYLISANHLITINYTLANETVTSSQSIGDEFAGLSSTLSDPITGAFYDRYTNQVYFFKGDRYVGYDFATKKALEDFQLDSQVDPTGAISSDRPLVSSLPVIGILGRQHQVDGVYHDLSSDVVYVLSGMKFYTYLASEFKNGAFRAARQPAWRCINEHLLDGCHFDEAYPNPCNLDEQTGNNEHHTKAKQETRSGRLLASVNNTAGASSAGHQEDKTGAQMNFSQEQQMKLRSIAARGNLLDFLVENTLLSQGAARAVEPFLGDTFGSARLNGSSSYLTGGSGAQERIVIYLLTAMVAITVVVTAAMIVVIINWTKWKSSVGGQEQQTQVQVAPNNQQVVGTIRGQTLRGPSEFRAPTNLMLGNQYLANQFMRHQNHPHHHQHHHNQHQSFLGHQLIGDSLSSPGPPLPLGKPPSKFSSSTATLASTGRRQPKTKTSSSRHDIDSSAL